MTREPDPAGTAGPTAPPPAAPPAAPDDGEAPQRALLARNKRRALALLLFAAAVFVGASLAGEGFLWGLVRATAEAAVIGALADWFAVTAIFRRPLGLPIPHTAIVPRNKDRIGEGLGTFVAGNFLTAPLIRAKLQAVGPAARIAAFLAAPANAEGLAARGVAVLPHVVRSLGDAEIRVFAARALGEQFRTLDLAALVGRSLGVLTRGPAFDLVMDRALDGLAGALFRGEGEIYRIVEERTAWWVPKAVDRRIAEAVVAGLAELLAELRDPGSARRRGFRLRVVLLARDLVRSPEHKARLEEVKGRLLDQPAVAAWLAEAWDTLRGVVLDDLAAPQSRTREAMAQGLQSLGRALGQDAAMRQRLDSAIEEAALALLVPYRGEIGRFIGDVVKSWETRTVVERLELALGPDLQYIRMTGTIVGATIGCLLYLAAEGLRRL